MSDSENFFDDLIARAPRKAGAAFALIGTACLGLALAGLSSTGEANEFAVILGPACLFHGLWLLARGFCSRLEQNMSAVLGFALGCWCLYDLKRPNSLLQQILGNLN